MAARMAFGYEGYRKSCGGMRIETRLMTADRVRTVLFLQGPSSPFMARVARVVASRGHRVRRINLCLGDRLFWRLPGAVDYRGRFEDWPAFVAAFLAREGVTDLVLLGDSRPYQAVAIEAAHAAGIPVHAVEHGYLRPDWITVEPDGLTSFSRFPRDPKAVRVMAAGRVEPDFTPVAGASFLKYAAWDVAWNLANVFGNPVAYRHYRPYQLDHPLVEYAGWILKLLGEKRARRRAASVLEGLAADPRPTFLVPLQLATDFQIRTHSPFPHLDDAVAWILKSFARHAPADARLLFKVHPMDNGWARWPARIGRMAAEGIAERVHVVDGGDLDAMVARSAGVVTVNSTVGITALRLGRPLIALGNAVFDVPGLTHQGPLSAFWSSPTAPDPVLARDFLRALAWASQVRGGFTAERAMGLGAYTVAERILEPGSRLPGRPVDRRTIAFRREGEWRAERN